MRSRAMAPALLTACLLLAGCSSGGQDTDDAPGLGETSLQAVAADEASPSKPVPLVAVQDDVEFSGTLGASVCWFDGSSISCANVGGSNVLLYLHDRTGELTGGQLTVSFTADAGTGPYATAFVAERCPDDCRVVSELASNRPALTPSGPTGTFDLDLPAATLLANQTLAVRVAPLLLSSVAHASPTYDIQVEGTLDFLVPA